MPTAMPTPTPTTIEELARQNAALLAALAASDAKLAAQKAQIDLLAKDSEAKQGEIERLTHRLQALQQRLYGRRSEKIDPGQLLLFVDGEEETPPPTAELAPDDEEVLEVAPRKKPRKPRSLKHRDLPRVRVEHDVPEADRTCACCGETKARIGEETREEIDYVPASVVVTEHVRPKYACRRCADGVVIADLPPALIERGMPGPGLLAQIATAKFADHLPLYRQEAIFLRHGLELSRQTMCDWIKTTAFHLQAVVLAMRRELLRRPVIQSDDTHVMMQTNGKSKGGHRAFLWTWTSPERDLVLFEFHLTRGQVVVDEFLSDFTGEVLLADGYAGYNPCPKRGVKRAGCFAHARRYVKDGMASHPREAAELLVLLQMLYVVEKRAKELELDAEARLALRQQESRPILDDLRSAIDRLRTTVLPSSALGKALGYLDAQWPHLMVFVEDGRVPIDNNGSEQMIRPVALGRKNWLFAGSKEGGETAAVFYSLIGSCRLLGIPPFDYLRDVLARISTHPHRRIDELTPAGWKAARERVAVEAEAPSL